MITAVEALEALLAHLQARLACRYAQWLVEDPVTWDYRVVAERIPEGREGYAIAHRTGVIGQAFRAERAIAVADTRRHPLYDPFDTDVDWEIAIPVWRGDSLAAVLNVEGSGSITLHADQWDAIASLVYAATGWRIPKSPPDPTAAALVKTRWATFPAWTRGRNILEPAMRLAGRGRTVLVIGALPDGLCPRSLTVYEAEARHLPLAECVRGIAPRVDILPLGPVAHGMRTFNTLGGITLVNGRYEFALVSE